MNTRCTNAVLSLRPYKSASASKSSETPLRRGELSTGGVTGKYTARFMSCGGGFRWWANTRSGLIVGFPVSKNASVAALFTARFFKAVAKRADMARRSCIRVRLAGGPTDGEWKFNSSPITSRALPLSYRLDIKEERAQFYLKHCLLLLHSALSLQLV